MKKSNFEKQRQEIVAAFKEREKQLQEYGVPGMKWGERNLKTRLKSRDTGYNQSANKVKAVVFPGEPGLTAYHRAVGAQSLSKKMARLSQASQWNVANAKTKLGKDRLLALSTASHKVSVKADRVAHRGAEKARRMGVYPAKLPYEP